MINPVHNIKKFVKYAGNEKPAASYIREVSGWLDSGLKDKNGVEIFEGDILVWQVHLIEARKLPVSFHDGYFWLSDINNTECQLKADDAKFLEVIGHIATEENHDFQS